MDVWDRLQREAQARFDRLLAAVGEAYEQEARGRPRGTAERRREAVKRLLAGELVADDVDLAYDLEGSHLAVMAEGEGAEALLQALARGCGRRLLAVQREEEPTWAGWLGGARQLSSAGARGPRGDRRDGRRRRHRRAGRPSRRLALQPPAGQGGAADRPGAGRGGALRRGDDGGGAPARRADRDLAAPPLPRAARGGRAPLAVPYAPIRRIRNSWRGTTKGRALPATAGAGCGCGREAAPWEERWRDRAGGSRETAGPVTDPKPRDEDAEKFTLPSVLSNGDGRAACLPTLWGP